MKAFVIRVWTPADEVEAHVHTAPELRGVVELIGSAQAVPFRSDGELVQLLREGVQREAHAAQAERRR
jgi:hypothetical protein